MPDGAKETILDVAIFKSQHPRMGSGYLRITEWCRLASLVSFEDDEAM
jgi:hypothetical protein